MLWLATAAAAAVQMKLLWSSLLQTLLTAYTWQTLACCVQMHCSCAGHWWLLHHCVTAPAEATMKASPQGKY
jgi:hypothetical protein